MNFRFTYGNSIAQNVIVEYDATRQLYSTRNFTSELGRKLNNFRSHRQRNDQSHRDMKYHRNMKENIMCIDMYQHK